MWRQSWFFGCTSKTNGLENDRCGSWYCEAGEQGRRQAMRERSRRGSWPVSTRHLLWEDPTAEVCDWAGVVGVAPN
ncbi:hypothetical protein [uncultured Corynebacterium sp.]|uniref:hypothetical protein n=1 Tax=uncultured Corynebacterium sp. TaxID=159447 RepID=UPI00288B1C97|nr:hypothetical protein [uncultured Corynebacterium sp.]